VRRKPSVPDSCPPVAYLWLFDVSPLHPRFPVFRSCLSPTLTALAASQDRSMSAMAAEIKRLTNTVANMVALLTPPVIPSPPAPVPPSPDQNAGVLRWGSRRLNKSACKTDMCVSFILHLISCATQDKISAKIYLLYKLRKISPQSI